MNIVNVIEEVYNNILKEYEEYTGDHKAPISDSPLHDVRIIFGKDFYEIKPEDAAKYYGNGERYDIFLARTIQSYHNKPNEPIKIYRAIPDFNKELKTKIDNLLFVARYYDSYRFFPPTYNKKYKKYEYLIEEYKEKVTSENPNLKYEEINKQASDLMYRDAYTLKDNMGKYVINPGDWVTIIRQYAVNHGKSHLNNQYKILTKTVKAKDIYTEGNMEEWGYNPQ
jgi:hypothetical protein